MAKNQPPPLPVVLELAALPRDQVGPFILLGVDKTAEKAQIEACWAQRLIWARKNQIVTPLEDVNWARATSTDEEKRIRADAGSLNVDTTEGVLRRLRERFGTGGTAGRLLDVEKPLADYTPDIAVPDIDEVRQAIPTPEVPCEFPAVARLLELFLAPAIDPWQEPSAAPEPSQGQAP